MDNVLPLIVASARTPRAVKRFVNKVRYIAMRLRQRQSDDRPLWLRLWGKPPAATPANPGIPDDVLVVLDYWKRSSLDTNEDLAYALGIWPSLAGYDRAVLSQWRTTYLRFASGLNVN
jgi:hypothetical protein